jgi:Uma2 family endonuclease
LPEGNEDDVGIMTVVQPDIAVICDKAKLDEKGCKGSPDLIVEIVSPSSAAHDYIKKLDLYEKRGIKEYWIMHPLDKLVTVYKLTDGGKYGRPEIYAEEDLVKVGIFPDLAVDLKEIFAE